MHTWTNDEKFIIKNKMRTSETSEILNHKIDKIKLSFFFLFQFFGIYFSVKLFVIDEIEMIVNCVGVK